MPGGEPVPGGEPMPGGEPSLLPGLCSSEITTIFVVG